MTHEEARVEANRLVSKIGEPVGIFVAEALNGDVCYHCILRMSLARGVKTLRLVEVVGITGPGQRVN